MLNGIISYYLWFELLNIGDKLSRIRYFANNTNMKFNY